jgi:hypothetical protein
VSRVRVAVIGLTLLLLTYLGAYVALLKPGLAMSLSSSGDLTIHRRHAYQVGGIVAEAVFYPVAWLDRRVRPSYWTEMPHEFIRQSPVPADMRSPMSDDH